MCGIELSLRRSESGEVGVGADSAWTRARVNIDGVVRREHFRDQLIAAPLKPDEATARTYLAGRISAIS